MSCQKHCAGSKVKTLHDDLRAASKPQNRAASPPSWRDQPMGFSVGDRLVGVSTRATGRSSTAPARGIRHGVIRNGIYLAPSAPGRSSERADERQRARGR
jgi:hypothetical protein